MSTSKNLSRIVLVSFEAVTLTYLLKALFIHTLCFMHDTHQASQTDTFEVQMLLGRPHS